MTKPTRRDFLNATAGGVVMSSLFSNAFAEQEEVAGGVPKRPLGRSGEKVSIIAIGGWHMGSIAEDLAIRIMHQAIDEGLTFFDNAWDYHDGKAEEVMGKALATGGRRDKVFLMTKNCGRDRATSQKHLEDSLRRLKTDHLDLWQFHEINYDNDPDWVFEQQAFDVAIEARKAGKVRYIGFTGHKDPHIHLDMLSRPKQRKLDFDWDTVQMPINIMDAQYRSFQKQVVPVCNERGIGVIGMKALGGGAVAGAIPASTKITATTCRRFALLQNISSLVCGIISVEQLKQDLEVARTLKPFAEDELTALFAETKKIATDGRFELFKSATTYDGPYHRAQHGFANQAAS